MSGWQRDGGYDLTTTKALHWHRYRPGCPCASVWDVVSVHLEPIGFTHAPMSNRHFARLYGPGLDDGRTDELFSAVSSRPSHGEYYPLPAGNP